MPVAEKVILRHRFVFWAGEAMKATRFILVCLLVTFAFSLFALTKVLLKRGEQNDKVQVSSTHHITKSDVFVAQASKGHNNNAPKTLDSHPDMSLSDEAVAFANPASKIGISPSKELPVSSVSEGKPNLPLPVGQKAEDISVSEGEPNSPVSPKHRSAAPVGTTDETESNPVGIGALYLNNPEVYGQDGELLPSPEDVLARKAKSILQNYKDRKVEAVIISEEVVGDDYETKPGEQSLKNDTGLDSANTGEHTVTVTNFTDVASTVEMLANQNTSDKAVDSESQTNQLLAALAENNPVDVRLQAIYLLADVAPDQVEKFLDDKEDVIRCEAERIVGILPQD